MKTLFLLMAQFDGRAEIPATEAAAAFLGIESKKALEMAKVQKLPFPVHRLGSRKSPWMVHLTDLAAYIDAQREAGQEEWDRLNAA